MEPRHDPSIAAKIRFRVRRFQFARPFYSRYFLSSGAAFRNICIAGWSRAIRNGKDPRGPDLPQHGDQFSHTVRPVEQNDYDGRLKTFNHITP
jgi:hypothetical protein